MAVSAQPDAVGVSEKKHKKTREKNAGDCDIAVDPKQHFVSTTEGISTIDRERRVLVRVW